MYAYLETSSHDPAFNLAFEEYCLLNLTEYPRIILLWQNKNAIIIGRYQNAINEVDQRAVKSQGAKVIRRSTGGGAVYHDLGNLNYSFITPAHGLTSVDLATVAQPLITALNKMGIGAEVSGRNDIVLNGYKISGTAQCLRKDRLLHHGTLLYSTDFSIMSKLLTVDTTKLMSKGVKSISSRVGNIKDLMYWDKSILDFWQELRAAFPQLHQISLSEKQISEVKTLAQSKYSSWEWNYGKAPGYSIFNSKRFSGGKVEVNLEVKKGIISNISISGDFLGLVPLLDLEQALIGLRYERDTVALTLAAMPLSLYLGSISTDEFLSCLFFE